MLLGCRNFHSDVTLSLSFALPELTNSSHGGSSTISVLRGNIEKLAYRSITETQKHNRKKEKERERENSTIVAGLDSNERRRWDLAWLTLRDSPPPCVSQQRERFFGSMKTLVKTLARRRGENHKGEPVRERRSDRSRRWSE